MWVLIEKSYHKHTLVYIPIKNKMVSSVALVHYSIMSAKSQNSLSHPVLTYCIDELGIDQS
jgi:hypothetical protein